MASDILTRISVLVSTKVNESNILGISHLRSRADKGDIQAKVVLYYRVRNKVISDDNASADQFKV